MTNGKGKGFVEAPGGRISPIFDDGGYVPNSSNEERADGFGVIVDEVVV